MHHHSSVVTEALTRFRSPCVTQAISGTSHPMLETLGYLANFSLAFLVPAWMGYFSTALIPIYFTWFDIMNCIGHCGFEVMPKCLQARNKVIIVMRHVGGAVEVPGLHVKLPLAASQSGSYR